MRAFVDYFIDRMNEDADFNSKVVLVQPIAPIPGAFDLKEAINEQEGLYTLYLRGSENGRKVNRKRIISCVSRCLNSYTDFDEVLKCAENPELRFISCNTTEAGIAYDPSCQFADRPAASYPGKLTQFLYRRFQTFGNEPGKGFLILACELIDDNGKELEKCVKKYAKQWNLGRGFPDLDREGKHLLLHAGGPHRDRLSQSRSGCSQRGKRLYRQRDGHWRSLRLLGSSKALSPSRTSFPLKRPAFPILVTDDHKPYKQRKVRILNGAHTSMVLGRIPGRAGYRARLHGGRCDPRLHEQSHL